LSQVIQKFSRWLISLWGDSWMYTDPNVGPLVGNQYIISGYVWVSIPKNPIREHQLDTHGCDLR